MSLSIGTALGLLAPKYWQDVGVAADELGFHSLWMPDHLIFPTDMSGSPFPGRDHPPVPPETHVFDALNYLSFLAAKTGKIRLGTNVFLLGLRHPFVAARAIQTLDILSQGRCDIGIGAGWLRQEWEVTGMDPKTRGKRLDEAITICKRLWTEKTIAHQGDFYQFDEVMFEPKPIQAPHPPLYIGGESPAAFKRVALLGDGWYGLGHTPESVKPLIEQLQQACENHKRDFAELKLIVLGEIQSDADLSAWENSGIHQLIVTPWKRGKEAIQGLSAFAEQYF